MGSKPGADDALELTMALTVSGYPHSVMDTPDGRRMFWLFAAGWLLAASCCAAVLLCCCASTPSSTPGQACYVASLRCKCRDVAGVCCSMT